MKYTFKVQEILYAFVEVEAETTDAAREKVEQMSYDGDIEVKEIEEVNYFLEKAEA